MSEINPDERILVLRKIDGLNAKTSTGLVDNRLFTGENKLKAYKSPEGLWYLKYDSGILPDSLKQQFTTFTMLIRILKEYFRKRNIEIKEVIY